MNGQKEKTKTIEYFTLAITLVNLIVVTAGGYFFVGKYEVKLLEADVQLRELELSFAETREDLKLAKKKANITTESIGIVSSLRPNFDFEINQEVLNRSGVLTIRFDGLNSGSFRLQVSPRQLWITETLFREDSQIKEKDILAYYDDLKPITDVEPNGAISNSFDVELPPEHPSTVYYLMVYEVITDPIVTSIAESYVGDISQIPIENLSKSIQKRYGAINL